jgi:hypothetical protein
MGEICWDGRDLHFASITEKSKQAVILWELVNKAKQQTSESNALFIF